MLRRIAQLLAGSALLLVLTNCGKDDPVRPHFDEQPRILSVSPAPWAILTGTVTLSIDATDAESVSLVVGGLPVATTSRRPFQLVWDTISQENGARQAMITARNPLGAVDSTLTLLISNTGRGIAVVSRESDVVVMNGATHQFIALSLGSGEPDVTWEVAGSPAPSYHRGRITADGFYTAPEHVPEPPVAMVIAHSVEDPSRTAAVAVHLEGVSLEIRPGGREVVADQQITLSARVFGTQTQAVLWTIDEGPDHGSITEVGVFTAPLVPPDPPRATVRATSVADPSRSVTAIVSILADFPPLPPDEAAAITRLSWVSYRASLISDQVTLLATRILRRASEVAGTTVLTGRLEQTGNGSWNYTPGGPEATSLIVIPRTGPETELTTTGLTVERWPYWEPHSVSGCDFKGSISCRLRQPGHFDLVLTATGAESPGYYTEFNRTLRGAITDGNFMSVDLTDTGLWDESNHVGSTSHRVTGSAVTLDGAISFEDNFDMGFGESCYIPGGAFSHGARWQLRDEARFGPYTFSLTADMRTAVGYACQYGLVYNAQDWQAVGDLVRNSILRGRVGFNGAVAERGQAPKVVLAGATILREPGKPSLERIIFDPFQYE